MKRKVFDTLDAEEVAVGMLNYWVYGARDPKVLWLDLEGRYFFATSDTMTDYSNYYSKALSEEKEGVTIRVGHYLCPDILDLIEDIEFIKDVYL